MYTYKSYVCMYVYVYVCIRDNPSAMIRVKAHGWRAGGAPLRRPGTPLAGALAAQSRSSRPLAGALGAPPPPRDDPHRRRAQKWLWLEEKN